ncbi:hypothetical protein J22TS1_43690 [Siminovitchia terrae]|uniref:phage tail domain-containing protein n=1 Tax=Siminovitchia terrae TaxID=1914933 RepID=UPI001B26AFC7|nr:phage tail domain-containing protein [Siminovitchia terrae]GIN93318.1 hypothetical protein J22TS1_43690 [Siminovitchia terrae]
MTFKGIEFNGRHSFKDLGLTIKEKSIGNPSKIKIKERVPFSNQIYDFSGIYGGQEYEERTLSYEFNVVEDSNIRSNYEAKKTEIINWLSNSMRKGVLKDDDIPGYYFLAEVEEGPEPTDFNSFGTLSVTFVAYPFKIGELEEGNDIWDTFNFLLDYAQSTEFTVSRSSKVTLYNPGANMLKPTIRASAPMTIKKGNATFNVPAGESSSYDFLLVQGANSITITGSGRISFHFRKELI